MSRTSEEKGLLKRLASGDFDGIVGDDLLTSGGSTIWNAIKNGIPVSYRQDQSKRFFNGKENEKIPGKRVEKYFETDDQKLAFLRKYGWLIDDDDVKAYSAKFKPGRR